MQGDLTGREIKLSYIDFEEEESEIQHKELKESLERKKEEGKKIIVGKQSFSPISF